LKTEAWLQAACKGTEAYNAIEIVLKGLEIPLPKGVTFLDKGGNERNHIRSRWWEQGREATYRSIAMMDEASCAELPDQVVPTDVLPGYADETPVIVGHYWLKGTPKPMSTKVACVDYTVTEPAPFGKLAAYRWDGETHLEERGFTWV
jgi:hypothetical protein